MAGESIVWVCNVLDSEKSHSIFYYRVDKKIALKTKCREEQNKAKTSREAVKK